MKLNIKSKIIKNSLLKKFALFLSIFKIINLSFLKLPKAFPFWFILKLPSGLEKDYSKNRTVIHTLRHTFASHLAINGTPIFTIKELMNHSDIEQTMKYAKLAPDSGKKNVINLYK